MDNFNFVSPTYFAFGKAKESELGQLCLQQGTRKILLHYGSGSAERSGLLERCRQALRTAKLDFVELGGVQPNPRASLVYEGIDLCRREQVDFIVAVGGGSVIDSAKAIALGVPYEGDFWQVYFQRLPISKALGVGVVLTLTAAGSEASNSSVISNDSLGLKYGYNSDLIRPRFAVMNPELCYSLPAYQTACGIVDMMAHIMERYLSNTSEVELTDRLCEACLKSIIAAAPQVMERPDHYGARANLMWAGMLAHNNLLGVGREQDWASHAMEHELSALYDCAHGAGLAVVLPAFMQYTYKQSIWRFAQLAVRVWNLEMDFARPEETALRGIFAFKAFFHSLGMPTNFAQLGARAEDIPRLSASTRFNNGEHLGFFKPLTRADVAAIFQLCV